MRFAARVRLWLPVAGSIRAALALALIATAGRPSRGTQQEAPAPVAEAPHPGTLAAGAMAPDFSAPRLDGGTLSLASLRGHVVLLDFWAVACPPCRIEMPELESIHRRYAARGLRVVGVTEMDPALDEARRFVNGTGVTYPIVLDPGARIGALYALVAHPTTFVIDARGRVRFVSAGYLRGDEKEIERAVREALSAAGGGP